MLTLGLDMFLRLALGQAFPEILSWLTRWSEINLPSSLSKYQIPHWNTVNLFLFWASVQVGISKLLGITRQLMTLCLILKEIVSVLELFFLVLQNWLVYAKRIWEGATPTVFRGVSKGCSRLRRVAGCHFLSWYWLRHVFYIMLHLGLDFNCFLITAS